MILVTKKIAVLASEIGEDEHEWTKKMKRSRPMVMWIDEFRPLKKKLISLSSISEFIVPYRMMLTN